MNGFKFHSVLLSGDVWALHLLAAAAAAQWALFNSTPFIIACKESVTPHQNQSTVISHTGFTPGFYLPRVRITEIEINSYLAPWAG